MNQQEVELFYPQCQKEWRSWLAKNHNETPAVWVIFYKHQSGKPTISWRSAVDEALCFGWIDSIRKTLDEERSMQFFSKRKPRSTWSKINKAKVQDLIEARRMCEGGLSSIKTAQDNGSWIILDEVEELLIPEDLEAALNTKMDAMKSFLELSKSKRKAFLQGLVLAKKPETKQKRIIEIVSLCSV